MTIAELRRLREAGFTYQQIGDKADIPWTTIRSRCQSLGIKPQVKVVHSRNRPFKFNPPYELIELMYWQCELSTNEIAYELDISKNTLQTWMDRNQFPRRSHKQAWTIMAKRGNGPFYNPWSHEMAVMMGQRSAEARRQARKA